MFEIGLERSTSFIFKLFLAVFGCAVKERLASALSTPNSEFVCCIFIKLSYSELISTSKFTNLKFLSGVCALTVKEVKSSKFASKLISFSI